MAITVADLQRVLAAVKNPSDVDLGIDIWLDGADRALHGSPGLELHTDYCGDSEVLLTIRVSDVAFVPLLDEIGFEKKKEKAVDDIPF